MNKAYLPYIVTEIYCMIFTATILLRVNHRLGAEQEVTELKRMLCCYIVMLGTDVACVYLEGRRTACGYILNIAVNSASMIAVALGCYFWFRFVELRLNPDFPGSRKKAVLISIPLACIILADILSIFTGWVIYIDAEGNCMDGILSWYQFGLNYLYLLIPALQSLHLAFHTRERSKRIEYGAYVLYMIGPLIAGFAEDSLPTIPILELNIFMVIQLLFMTIYLDRMQQLSEKDQELVRSRTTIMLSQIQPHFLYNTLAVIQDMCHEKAPEAEAATIEFSEFLRGNLDAISQNEPVMFERELRHTRTYLSLERRRFGNLLNVEFDIGPTQFRLPTLSLQPLVENAVRYGIMKKENGGTVSICTEETGTHFIVTVEDDGVGFNMDVPKADGRSHIGITNVRNRIETMCGGSLTVTSVPEKGTRAVIMIPKRGIM